MKKSNTIICHARYEVICDEEGNVVDSICTEANQRFCEFYHQDNPVGKRRSELLFASNPLVSRLMKVVVTTGESEVFSYEETGLGCVDVIIEAVGDGKSCDIYTIDVMHVKEMQVRRQHDLRKYSIASQLYGLTIWQWDIEKHKVYADNVLTDLNGNENMDTTRDQIVWDEFDRLDYIYEEDKEMFKNKLYSMRDGEATSLHWEFRITREGQIHTCEARAIVDRFSKEGKPLGIIAVSRLIK